MARHPRSTAKGSDVRPSVDGADHLATLVKPNLCHETVASGLAREVSRVGARGRLEGELRLIAIDLLGPSESDEFPAVCASWVATTTEAVVSRVSDSALAALVEGLDSLLVAIPPDVARYLERARTRHEAGFK